MRFRVTISDPWLRDRVRRAMPVVVWAGAAGALILLVFSVSFYLAVRATMRSTEVGVPDLVGLDLETADHRVQPEGLVLQVVDQRHDPAVPSGRIIEQTPRAGFPVRRGRKIKLVTSLGGEVLEVPELVGQADRAIAITLRQEGLMPGEVARVYSLSASGGTVIGQVPPPGTPAVPRTRVHRLVSDGPRVPTWVMPDLTGVRRDQAERWIAQAGFRRGAVRRVRMVGQPPDTVVGQLPLAGYPVRSREVVELTVAQ